MKQNLIILNICLLLDLGHKKLKVKKVNKIEELIWKFKLKKESCLKFGNRIIWVKFLIIIEIK